MTKQYRYINHTADLGIEVWGKSIEELFANIARAIFETQIKGDIKTDIEKPITLQAESTEDLFIDWCRELLYYFSVDGFIPRLYEISIKDQSLDAQLRGDRFDPKRHQVKLEIKNPTYHNFSIEKNEENYCAKIIFDV
ncbi:archease [candidate division WOR-3 bacterium]|nr:archease [candidate division WOR-3 bacterium]